MHAGVVWLGSSSSSFLGSGNISPSKHEQKESSLLGEMHRETHRKIQGACRRLPADTG